MKSKVHMYDKTIKYQPFIHDMEIKKGSYKKTENINSNIMSSAIEPAIASAVVFSMHFIIAL